MEVEKENNIEIKSFFCKEIRKQKTKLVKMIRKNKIMEKSKKARIKNYRKNFKFKKISVIRKNTKKKRINNEINILFSKKGNCRIFVLSKKRKKQKIKFKFKNYRQKVIELEKNQVDNTDIIEITIEDSYNLKIIVDSGATMSSLNYLDIKEKYPHLLNKKYKASRAKNIKVQLADNSVIKNYGLYYYNIQLDKLWYKVPFILSDSANRC